MPYRQTVLEKKFTRECVCGYLFRPAKGGGEYRWHRQSCQEWVHFKNTWNGLCACGCGMVTKFLKAYLDRHQPHPSGSAHPNYGKHFTEETKKKISESNLGKVAWNKGGHHSKETKHLISERLTGRKRSPEFCRQRAEMMKGHIIKVSAEGRKRTGVSLKERSANGLHPMQGRHHSAKTLKILSAKAAERMVHEGGFISGRFWSGKNNKWILYRSSYEKFFYMTLEAMTVVEQFHVEPHVIEYKFKGRQRHYVPDVLVTYIFGFQEAFEVKPSALLEDLEVQAKHEAATLFYGEMGIRFSVITENDFGALARVV